MARKKNAWMWWVGGGLALYFLLRPKTTGATTTTTTGSSNGTSAANTTSPGSSVTTQPIVQVTPGPLPLLDTATTSAATASSTGTATVPGMTYAVPYDPRMDTLQAWAESTMTPGNLAQWNRMKYIFTQADWDGLFDLYFNDWTGGGGNNAARTLFWNNWRMKYHINDDTYT